MSLDIFYENYLNEKSRSQIELLMCDVSLFLVFYFKLRNSNIILLTLIKVEVVSARSISFQFCTKKIRFLNLYTQLESIEEKMKN